jgi:histidyl-tRNA synthetase
MPYKDELDPDSQERLSRNPLRILDSKDEQTLSIAQNAPSILDYLDSDSKRYFEQVQQLLSDLGIDYQLNPRLVRGLDYYTHTAFEIQSDDLGAQATVCGGGRYDGLVAELGTGYTSCRLGDWSGTSYFATATPAISTAASAGFLHDFKRLCG